MKIPLYNRVQVAKTDFPLAANVGLQLPLYVLPGLCKPLEGPLVINVDFCVMVNVYYSGMTPKNRICTEFGCCKMLHIHVMAMDTSMATKSQ